MYRNALLSLALLALSGTPTLAMPITVDEILFDSSTNLAGLSGTVDMVLAGNKLTITLTNTSLNSAGDGAGVLLTGLAFSLPKDVSISSGNANMGTSEAVGFSKPASGDVSGEWGYDNSPLDSGMFKDRAAYDYNTVISSMESMTTTQFSSNSLVQPTKLGGPEFGLISQAETNAGGQQAIRSSLILTVYLAGAVPADLLNTINNGRVGISFGSPDSSNRKVPEPASLSLLAAGLAGAAFMRRRRRAA